MINGFIFISSGEVLLSTNKTKKTWEDQESNLAPHESEQNQLPPQLLSETSAIGFVSISSFEVLLSTTWKLEKILRDTVEHENSLKSN
jgi:hypothetical protein